MPLIWHQRVINLNRFGAPHDFYLLDDLLEGSLPDYKLYIFLNPFHLNTRRRAALEEDHPAGWQGIRCGCMPPGTSIRTRRSRAQPHHLQD